MSLNVAYDQLIKDKIKDQLTLEATNAKNDLMSSVLNLMPNKTLTIEPVTLSYDENKDELNLKGDLNLQWKFVGLNEVHLEITNLNWSLTNQAGQIISHFVLEGHISISGILCPTTLTVTPENRILNVIQGLDSISLDRTLKLFSVDAMVPDSVSQYLARVNSPLTEIDICYDPLINESIEISLLFKSESLPIIPKKFELSNAKAILQMVKFQGNQPPSPDLVSFQIQTDIDLNGKPLQGVMSLQANQMILEVENKDDTLSINNLTGLFSTSISSDSFTAELHDIGLKNITISKSTFYLLPNPWKVIGCDVTGTIGIGTLKSNLSISLPSWDYSGDLTQWPSASATPEDIPLTDLLKGLCLDTSIFPKFNIHSFVFSGTAGKNFLFSTEVVGNWELLFSALILTDVTLEFSKVSDMTTGYGFSLNSTMSLGGLNFFISGTYKGEDGGWVFEGGTTDDSPISISRFVNECVKSFQLASLPLFPDINIRNISTSFQEQSGDIKFSADLDKKLTIPFLADSSKGQVDATLEIDFIHDSITGKKELNWRITNNIELGGSLYRMEFTEENSDLCFQFVWQRQTPNDVLGLTNLFNAFGIDIKNMADFNFKVSEMCFEYVVSLEKITLHGKTGDGADAIFIASRSGLSPDSQVHKSGNWDFIFIYQFAGNSKLSQLPIIGHELTGTDFLSVEETGVIISSVNIINFEIPQLPPLNSTESFVKSDIRLNILKGVSVMAVLDLTQNQNESLKFIMNCVEETKLIIAASFGSEGKISISSCLQGGLAFKTSAADSLAFKNPFMRIEISTLGQDFQIGGDIEIACDHHVFDVCPSVSIGSDKLDILLPLKIQDEGLPGLFGLKGLYLDSCGFKIGGETLPVPSVYFGFQGKTHIVGEPKAADEFAIIFQVIEQVLTPKLLLISLQELSAANAIKLYTGENNTDSLPSFVNEIKFTDVLYYWADSIITMPDGSIAQPGICFNANLQILDFKAHGDFSVGLTAISGLFEMSPIHFGTICSISGKGKGISAKTVNGKRVYTTETSYGATMEEIVPPGGPIGSFHTLHSPFLSVSILVSLFDLVNCEVEAEIGLSGMTFLLEMDVSNTAKAVLAMTLNVNGFHAHSEFQLHINTDLGPVIIENINFGTIHLDTDINLSMTLVVDDAFQLELIGDFDFEGVSLHMPPLSINQPIPSLRQISTYIINHLKDKFEEIFKDVIDFSKNTFLQTQKAIQQLEEEAQKKIDDFNEGIKKETGKIVSGAIQTAQALDKDAQKIAEETIKVKAKMESIQKNSEATISEIKAVQAQKITELQNRIDRAKSEATKEIDKIGTAIENETAIVSYQVQTLISNANEDVAILLDQSAKAAAKLIDDAQNCASTILNEANNIADHLNKEANKLWDEAGKLAQAALDELKKAAEKTADTVKKVWNSLFS